MVSSEQTIFRQSEKVQNKQTTKRVAPVVHYPGEQIPPESDVVVKVRVNMILIPTDVGPAKHRLRVICLASCPAVPTDFIKLRVVGTVDVVFKRAANRPFVPFGIIFVDFN